MVSNHSKPQLPEKKQQQLMRLASYCSVAMAVVLIIVKVISFFMTNSLSLLSGLFDSGLDLGASIVSLVAIHQALVPADKEHRFGHGKAEALGGLAQGIIISFSGLFLLFETGHRFLNPAPLQRLDVGLGVMLLSILLTYCLICFQRYVIRTTHSLAIDADNSHYTGDIIMNSGIIVSMLFSYLLGWQWVDSLFALFVAFYLFYSAYRIISKVQSILMDKELPPQMRNKIKKIVLQHKDIRQICDLRTRNAGMKSFVQFSIVLNGEHSLKNAHDLCDHLENELKEFIPNCEFFIHPEPTDK
ncbi:MAG: cation diffusion facilitator family transporter [Alphaproteobacteria bacterium]|nr:cation diffusion facilitator family transporter [Alphaproteobacteria bacterium]